MTVPGGGTYPGPDTYPGADTFPGGPTSAYPGPPPINLPASGAGTGGPLYELVAVARIPQMYDSPLFIEIDPIEWRGLTYTNELSQPQTLEAVCPISSLTDSVVQRLRALHEFATELWVFRHGAVVFAGPLLGWEVRDQEITLKAAGILYYLNYMVLSSDLTVTGVDQNLVVKGLVDQWQSFQFGNFGIDTTSVGLSGNLISADWKFSELNNLWARIGEMGDKDHGFDIEVEPATRKLLMWSPTKGLDRSTGSDAIIIDERNITSGDVICSVAVGDVASDAYGTSTHSGSDDVASSLMVNFDLRASFGRTAVTGTWEDLSTQAQLNQHTKGLLDARDSPLMVPGPGVRVTVDADLDSYGVGDTITFDMAAPLGVSGPFRIQSQKVSVSPAGLESVDLTFT